MSVRVKEIGWYQEANLYWEISKKLDRIIASLGTTVNQNNPPVVGDAITFKGDTQPITFRGQTEPITFKIV